MSNFYPVFHICGNVIICGLCLSPSYVHTHIHMALVGVWGGCVKKGFGVEQLFSHAILRDPQRPSERLVRLVGRGSESSTPPAPLNQNVSSFICYGNQGLLKISFGKRILLKMRCGNH